MSALRRLEEFMDGLEPHDGSIGLALVELIRHVDEDGTVERSDWVTAVRTAHARKTPARAVIGSSDDSLDTSEQLARYLRDHVLAGAEQRGLVTADPSLEEWQRVRLAPDLWEAVGPRRDQVVARLDQTVRNLLSDESRAHERSAAALGEEGERSTLRSDSLVKIYRKRKVVNEVSIEVSQGEIVGLLGPNGAGKTTTFYMVVGLIRPDEGKVFLDDRELTDTPMYKRARYGIGYLAQEPSIFRKLTVEENIKAILETMDLPKAARKVRLEQLLDELGLRPLRKAKAYSLSGGERRRLEITRALVSDPKFMLLDEPFAGVDPIAVHDIQQIVAELRHRGIGVIISDHNVEQTLEIVDRAYIMYEGRVRVSGTVAELVWNDDVAEVYFGPALTERMRARYRKPEKV
ncbi:MAG: LPS export ABC transporter ATP-binding protein [Longimicrobiales bacterium]